MDSPTLSDSALQDVILTQGFVLTGLVAQLTGCALQEDIASTTRRLILLGQQGKMGLALKLSNSDELVGGRGGAIADFRLAIDDLRR